MRTFFRDGYDFTGTFSDEGWPVLNFTYRPAPAQDVYDFQLKRDRALTGEDLLRAMVALVFPDGQQEQRLRAWDLVDRGGTAQPVNATLFRKLPTTVQTRIISHVCSYVAGTQADADAKNSGAASA